MIEFSEKEVYTTLPEEKKVHRKGTEMYFTRCTRLESDIIEDFEETNIEPSPTPQQLLDKAKADKTAELEAYDVSDAVNSFDVVTGGNTIKAWFTPEQRADYKNSIDAAELLGREVVRPVINGREIKLPVSVAKTALAKIQLYANKCYGVTEQHKAAVNALTSVEAVEAYDFEKFYPEKLTFDVTEMM